MESKSGRRAKPDPKNMNRDELMAFVRKKRECNTRAQAVVVRLICESPTEAEFLSVLPHLERSHYDDVTVERSIAGDCGYPLCGRKLTGPQPKQTYRICTKTNRVYDITFRKNFCSNQCYNSSEHIKMQIPTDPLWLRDSKSSPKFSTLPLDNSGRVGEAVDLSVPKIDDSTKSTQFTSLLDFTQMALNDICPPETEDDPDNDKSADLLDNELPNPDKQPDLISCETQKPDESIKTETTPPESKQKEIPAVKVKKDTRPVKKPVKVSNKSDERRDASTHIEKCLGEWFGIETLLFVLGERKIRELVEGRDTALTKYMDALCRPGATVETRLQYQRLCRKLQFLELEDRMYDTETIGETPAKPLPDYSALQKESEHLQLKVGAYFKGETSVQDKPIPDDETETFRHLPPVDSSAQRILRRKIVMQGLNKAMPDILLALDLPSEQIFDLNKLIETFNLNAHNIVFKRIQWNIVAMIMIKLLSIRNPELNELLNSTTSLDRLKLLLLSYGMEPDYPERLIWWLTDVDRILKVDPAVTDM